MEPIHLGHLAVWKHTAAQGTPKARILIVHGIGEHSGRHKNTYDFLNSNGFEVVRFDLRGAGRSGGRRQHIDSWSEYVDDTTQVYNWICSDLDPLPLFVLGHSMGGAIAIYFASHFSNQLRGLILSAPAYKVGDAVSAAKLAAAKILSRLTPTLRVPKGGDPTAVSRDPKVVADYIGDPLACHFNTVRQGNEVLAGISQSAERSKSIVCPTLLVHGTSDRIIPLEGTFEIFQVIPAKDKVFHILPHFYHEPHNDFDKENYFTALLHWLARHTDATPSDFTSTSTRSQKSAVKKPNKAASDKQQKLHS